jgi:hypothetical protein
MNFIVSTKISLFSVEKFLVLTYILPIHCFFKLRPFFQMMYFLPFFNWREEYILKSNLFYQNTFKHVFIHFFFSTI